MSEQNGLQGPFDKLRGELVPGLDALLHDGRDEVLPGLGCELQRRRRHVGDSRGSRGGLAWATKNSKARASLGGDAICGVSHVRLVHLCMFVFCLVF